MFNSDLGKEQTVKMGSKNAHSRAQNEKGYHFQDTSDSLVEA